MQTTTRGLLKASALCLAALRFLLHDAKAATLWWTGAGGDSAIQNPANWSPSQAPSPGDVLIYSGTTSLAPELTADLAVASITFDSGSGPFTLGGTGTLTLESGIRNNSTAVATILNAVNLGAQQTWTTAEGTLQMSGAIANGGFLLTIDGTHAVTLNGVVSGTGGLTKVGGGELSLTAANTYSGTTTLSEGSIVLGNNQALGTGLLVLDGGTLNTDASDRSIANNVLLRANSTIGGPEDLTFTGLFSQSGNRTLTVDGLANVTFSGGFQLSDRRPPRTLTIAGSGNVIIDSVISSGPRAKTSHLTKTGTGTLTLSGNSANTFKGNFKVNGGTVLLAKSFGIAVPGNLTIGDGSGMDTVRLLGGEQIADASAVVMNSSGILDLNGFSEKIGSLSGAGAIAFGGGTLTTGGTNTSTTYSGLLNGPGGLIKIGTGVLTLSGSSNSLDSITANAGTILITRPSVLSNQTVLGAAGTGVFDLSSVSATAAGLNLNGGTVRGTTGVLTLLGDTTATSNAGSAALVSARLSLSGTRIFDVTAGGATSDLNLTGIVDGTGSLVKTGGGILTLSAQNAYSGSTTINQGILRIGGGTAIPDNSAVELANAIGAVFDLANSSETIGSLAGGGRVTLGSGILTLGANNASTAYAGAISGTGGIVKNGTGTLSLSGSNTFTGPTVVNLGTLQLNSNAASSASTAVTLANASGVALEVNSPMVAIGSLAGGGAAGGNVVLGAGTLAVGANNTSTSFAGVISGSGTVRKTGTGILTFTGAQTLTGGLEITGGTLALTGAGSAPNAQTVRIGTSATLSLDNTTTNLTDRLNDAAPVIFDGGTLRFVSGTTNTTELVGPLILAAGNSQLSVVHNAPRTRATALTFSSLGSLAPGATLNFSATGGTLGSASSGPQVYIGGLAPGFIGGWATVGADFAEYSTFGIRAMTGYYTGGLGINVNDATQIVLLTSTSPASAYTLTRSGTTTDKGLNLTDIPLVDLNSSATNTLNLASGGLLKSTSTPTTIIGSGRLTAGGASAGNLAVTVDSASSLTIAAPIIDNPGANGSYNDTDDGVVSLSKGGEGILVLSGTNTHTGPTFLNSGTIRVSSAANLGAPSGPFIFNGGTLNITSGFTTAPSKVFSVSAGLTGTLDIDSGETLTLGAGPNVLTNGGGASELHKSGAGTLVIPSSNPGFTGTLQLDAGSLEFRAADAIGGLLSLNGGTLLLRADADTAFASNVAVTANAAINVGTINGVASGAIHSIGTLFIDDVTLTISNFNGASLNVGATTLAGNATFAIPTGNVTFGPVSGGFSLTKSGAGTMTFSNPSTYLGATLISQGVLRGGASAFTSAASPMTIATGALLDLNDYTTSVASLSGAGDVLLGLGTLTTGLDNTSTTYSGVVSGTGSLVKTGSGVLTVGGDNTYTGATVILGGLIRIPAPERIANTSLVSIADGATLDLNSHAETIGALTGAGDVILGSGALTLGASNSAATFSGIIAGTGSLVKIGSGTQELTGGNTYSGPTVVASGALTVQHEFALGFPAGETVVHIGAALHLRGDLEFEAEPLILNGAGGSGAGALRNLAGENLWTGPITLASAATIAADAGVLTISGPIVNSGNMLTIAGPGSISIESEISGIGGLSKNGPGTLALANPNIYTGVTNVNQGVLHMLDASALGVTHIGAGTSIGFDGALWMEADFSMLVGEEQLILNGAGIGGTGALLSLQGANAWAGLLTFAGDTTIGVNADSLLLSGGIAESGTRALTKAGAGALVLSGANTYTGPTFVNEGLLDLASTAELASSSMTVAAGATFSSRAGASLSPSAALTVNGAAIFHNPEQTIASVDGSSSGVITLNGTALSVGSGTLAGSIRNGSAPGSLNKTGPGTLVLNGNSSYTGNTTIFGGVLAVNSAASLGAGAALIFRGGTLRTDASFTLGKTIVLGAGGGTINTNGNDLNLTGSLTGSTLLTKTGSGTLTIAGNSNAAFSGGIQVEGGRLHVTGGIQAPVSVLSGAVLNGTGSTGPVTAAAGSTISAGNGLGILSIGDLTLASGATLHAELGGALSHEYDQLWGNGSVTLGGNLQVSLVNGFLPSPGDLFFLLINDGIDPIVGAFSGLAQDATVAFAGYEFVVSYSGDQSSGSFLGGNDFALQAIPEPDAYKMMLPAWLFAVGIFRARRRMH